MLIAWMISQCVLLFEVYSNRKLRGFTTLQSSLSVSSSQSTRLNSSLSILTLSFNFTLLIYADSPIHLVSLY